VEVAGAVVLGAALGGFSGASPEATPHEIEKISPFLLTSTGCCILDTKRSQFELRISARRPPPPRIYLRDRPGLKPVLSDHMAHFLTSVRRASSVSLVLITARAKFSRVSSPPFELLAHGSANPSDANCGGNCQRRSKQQQGPVCVV
jgi:hypothetical protein